jgi:hypothetical protein
MHEFGKNGYRCNEEVFSRRYQSHARFPRRSVVNRIKGVRYSVLQDLCIASVPVPGFATFEHSKCTGTQFYHICA